jgi:hypothetical protein
MAEPVTQVAVEILSATEPSGREVKAPVNMVSSVVRPPEDGV